MPARLKLKPLHEQVVVITGATSGIGLATAREAANKGAAVFLIARNEAALRTLVDEIKARGGRAGLGVADVGDEGQLRAAAEKCRAEFGGWDTWINDAGVTIYGPIRETTLEDQKRLFDTNYWGVVHGSLIAVEHLRMRPVGGALINVGSILGDAPIPVQGVYSAAEHAVKGFTNALRMDLMHENAPVSVSLIKPAAVDSPYKDHGKNLTDAPVRNPGPVYSVEAVAEAILHCAEHKVRELSVGGGGRALAGFYNAVPSIAEPLFARVMPAMHRDKHATRRRTDDALHQPGRDLLEHSSYGRVRRRSWLTQMEMHPFTVVGAALGVGAAAGGVALASHLRADRRRLRAERKLALASFGAGATAAKLRQRLSDRAHEALVAARRPFEQRGMSLHMPEIDLERRSRRLVEAARNRPKATIGVGSALALAVVAGGAWWLAQSRAREAGEREVRKFETRRRRVFPTWERRAASREPEIRA